MKYSKLLILFIIFCLAGCYNSEKWEPQGKISLLGYWPNQEGDSLGGSLSLEIENTGSLYISSSTILFSVVSTARTYYISEVVGALIPPEKRYFHTLDITLLEEEEETSLDKIELLDYYFE